MLVGLQEFDRRLMCLQEMVGWKRFKKGISHLKQWTGPEDKELMRVFLGLIAGAPKVTPQTMQACRAFIDFVYLAQYDTHSTATLGYLQQALNDFHNHKIAFIKTGVRRGQEGIMNLFNIPKVCAMHLFPRHIPEMGSSPQFDSNITEALHPPFAKELYGTTNKRDYFLQMCRTLDRRERVNHHGQFLEWRDELVKATARGRMLDSLSEIDRVITSQILEDDLGQDMRVINKKKRFDPTQKLSYRLTQTPHTPSTTIDDCAKVYGLPDLRPAMADYISFLDPAKQKKYTQNHKCVAPPTAPLPFQRISCWKYFRLFLCTVQNDRLLAPPTTVQALPPSDKLPHGRCNCVLVYDNDFAAATGLWGMFYFEAELEYILTCGAGYQIAQVRLIFSPQFSNDRHPLNGKIFAYVQWFSTPKRAAEDNIEMYLVHCSTRANGSLFGDVIELDMVSRAVEMLPKFGGAVSKELNSDNVMDRVKSYYFNCFSDKETFKAVY